MIARSWEEQGTMMCESMSTVFTLTFLYLFLLIPLSAHAQQLPDTLKPGESMNYSQSRVSPSGMFKLSFFSVPAGTNSKGWYLGIRYNHIPVETFVWVANRQKALPETGGLLSLTPNGTLRLTDSAGALFWSSSVTGSGSSAGVAQLLDTGNLVVTSVDGSYAWQSFDYPSDTLLPGMKVGWDLRSGRNRIVNSWKSSTDPSPGDYTMVMDRRGVPQVFVLTSNNAPPKWRAGPWNGQRFTGVPEMLSYRSMFTFTFVNNMDEIVYTFNTTDPAVIARLVVHDTGKLQRVVWNANAGTWNELWYVPKDICDGVNYCGAFGVCNTDKFPVCNCARGFQPKSPQEWYFRDASAGCARKTTLDCINGTDGFAVLSSAKLPDTSNATLLPDKTMSLDQCKAACLKNCSCTAYAAANMSTGPAGSGCILWAGALMDIRTFANSGQDLYLRVAKADLGDDSSRSHRSRVRLIIILVCTLAIATVLVGIGWTSIARKKRKTRRGRGVGDRRWKGIENDGGLDFELPIFSLSEIATATDDFSEKNKLGRGGFGLVYKGCLDDGQDVAVKRLGKNSMQGVDEFMNEVTLIAKLQHRNLVRILGCCVEEEERILIYEYAPNRSLDGYLFGDQDKETSLDWSTRYQIIMGIARGLVYLHHDSRLRIIHRDLKASNILLDKDMIPKISDFGMARIFGADDTEANTQRVVGTYGYMSPEYAMDGIFSIKSDVFSFGVLVLEIVSGKKNQGFYSTQSQQNLLSYVWSLWKEGITLELVDKSIGTSFSMSEVLKCIQIGLLCVQELPEDRPTMSSVVFMLVADSATLPQPKQPGFIITRGTFDTSSSSLKQDSHSVRNNTMSVVNGR